MADTQVSAHAQGTLNPTATSDKAEIAAARSSRVRDVVGSLTTKTANANRDPSAQYRLTNRGAHIAAVPVVHVTTGSKTMVFVQPLGQPKLAPGYRVDSVFSARNPHVGAAPVTK